MIRHHISECYYHLQLTGKYRRRLFTEEIEQVIMEMMGGYKECYEIKLHSVDFDENQVHVLCSFLPKYSAGQVVRLMKTNGKTDFVYL